MESSQIKQIEQYTKQWQAANAKGDKAGMAAAHAGANAVRASSSSGGVYIASGKGNGTGTYVEVSGSSSSLSSVSSINSNKTFYGSVNKPSISVSKGYSASAGNLSAGLGDASAPLGDHFSFGAQGPNAEFGADISLSSKVSKNKLNLTARAELARVSASYNGGDVSILNNQINIPKVTANVSFISAGVTVKGSTKNFKVGLHSIIGGEINIGD